MSSSSSSLLRFNMSVVEAHADSAIRRKPRRSWWPRPAAFYKAFEDRILFYDCFRYLDDRVLLVGPAPLNLQSDLATAIYTALPSGKVLSASIYPSRSTMLLDLPEVPEDTSAIRIEIGDTVVEANVQSRSMADFADRRVLFTINKNNRPTSEGHKPSSNNEKGSNDRPSSIGACNTAISPHKINQQTRPTLLYSTHQIAPNHLTTDNSSERACRTVWRRGGNP